MSFVSELVLTAQTPRDTANIFMTWKDAAGTFLVITTALDSTNVRVKMSLTLWANTNDPMEAFTPGTGVAHLCLQRVPPASSKSAKAFLLPG
ncbi:hypothetical protein Pst134EB_003703 [Puccinia striiformis f. sp. tritici]|nr:hypothetical protein Pst134EB_003703 [Puccinia striiformis f. sp. tritici]